MSPGIKVTADEAGVRAVGYQFKNDLVRDMPWTAKWISTATDKSAAAGCMRKEITLDTQPKHISAWISADMHYRLYVNGTLASAGPADAGTDFAGGRSGFWYADARDLTPFFHPGKNIIAAEVFNSRIGKSWRPATNSNAFFFEAEVTSSDGKKIAIQSDTSWRGTPAKYFQLAGHLIYDATREPLDWKSPGFDDSPWTAAAVSDDSKRPPLIVSEIPPLMETRIEPASITVAGKAVQTADLNSPITVNTDGTIAITFKRIMSGRLRLKIKGGGGAVVEGTLAERAPAKPGANGNRGFELRLRDGVQEFETPSYTSFTAIGLRFSKVTAPIQVQEITPIFQSYPVDYRGSFECSDEALNQIWSTSRWATQICMQDYHLDSPDHQEPICDPGDYLIESIVNYNAFGEPWLARQELRKFAHVLASEDYKNFHTSYSLLWLQMLMDYYDYTGDESLVRELSPFVHKLLDLFTSYRGKNGIISEARDYMFMDWVKIDGIACHHPPAVIGQGYMTAFYYRGLADGIRVATLTGDTARAAQYADLRKQIAEAFNRELWVADKGLYRDGKPNQTTVKPGKWLPADTNIETFSPHVNMLAVLYDLAPRDMQPAIVRKVLADPITNTQRYFMHFVLSAIDHAGCFDEFAPAQFKRWKIIPETQSFYENWDGGDLSHGWGSTPLYQISARVLGVRPLTPGFDRISITPTLCGLTWAKGRVPTRHGPVDVSWKLDAGKWQMDITIPEGTEAEAVIPLSGFKAPVVTINGKEWPISNPAAAKFTFATGHTNAVVREKD